LWNGYYDCVDVNVLSVLSTDVFGTNSTDTSLDLIDHCIYNMTLTGWEMQGGCSELKQGDTPATCLTSCAASNQQYCGCEGVQVSPVVLPTTAIFPGMFNSGTSHLPTGCTTTGMASTSSVCYSLRIGDPPIVGPPYKVVYDPEDPVFYSTCYRKKPGWVFAQTCPACIPPVLPVTNKFGYNVQESCITCRDMYTNQSPLPTPFWNITEECFACDGTLG